nr:unnamed protein product [Digitaria exilis]
MRRSSFPSSQATGPRPSSTTTAPRVASSPGPPPPPQLRGRHLALVFLHRRSFTRCRLALAFLHSHSYERHRLALAVHRAQRRRRGGVEEAGGALEATKRWRWRRVEATREESGERVEADGGWSEGGERKERRKLGLGFEKEWYLYMYDE